MHKTDNDWWPLKTTFNTTAAEQEQMKRDGWAFCPACGGAHAAALAKSHARICRGAPKSKREVSCKDTIR
jgi:hypothetical protein